MNTYARRSLVFLLLCGLLLSSFFVFQTTTRAAGPTVQVWLTTSDGSNHLTPQANLTFGSNTGNASTINVNEFQELQQMDGFGAAVTDSSAWLIVNKMSASQRNTLMQQLFDPNQGIGMSFVRIPMGASDFSINGPYSYDDLPAGQSDPNLNNFSINHDLAYIIPVLQQAHSLNPNLKFMANPWSPPAWMKTNGSMIGVSNGVTGTLNLADYGPLAQYFVKFIQAYQAQGIPIYAITPQNEPLFAPTNYPGMSWAAGDENNFIKNNLSPALASAGLSPKIIPYDHNWDNTSYPSTLLGDTTTRGDIAGISWHCYAGSPTSMTSIHSSFPTSEVYETECSTGAAVAPINTIDLFMQSVQNFSRTVELWNVALDPNHGPHTGGCPDCLGVVTVDQATGNVTLTNDYYLVGHFSKFAVPGAFHITSNNVGSVEDVAFKNPDGSKVVVAHNNGSGSSTFQVLWGNQGFNYTLPAGATVTFKWSGTQQNTLTNGGYAISVGGSAIGNFQADNYYLGGSSNTATVTDTISTSGINNPAPQAVYQNERYGNFSYVFPGLQAGASYTVRLHFAETFWTNAGQRVFNVAINGSQVLSNFDIVAATGGKDRAIVEQFTPTADNNGQLTIQFRPVVDYAKVDGIEVIPTNTTPGSLSINCGGGAVGNYGADANFSGGTAASTTASIDTSGVSNPAPMAVYQTERFGNFTYTMNGLSANARYAVSLQFAEFFWTAAGKRVFNVSINGTQVLSNFDIFANVGADKAIAKNFTTTASASGTITIQFTTVVDNAKCSGIQLVPLSGAATVDDSVQGSGINQFNYVGSGWNHCTSCDSNNLGFFNGSNSWDNSANDTVSITFNGSQIAFYGVVGPPHGIGAFSLDGGPEITLDFFAATNAGNTLLYLSPVLSSGQHTLTVRVTGNQSSNATWNGINPDRVDILP
ncbi:MAG TPA: malectin domain-containing carbohydrate-binding protein [Ktedonobacteraceae bacterium]|nr:malectin domain-containing carbohydrate-binding protein [Ktedonobacteraceae bacterium]